MSLGTPTEALAAAERLGAAKIDHAPDSPAVAAIERLITAVADDRSDRT